MKKIALLVSLLFSTSPLVAELVGDPVAGQKKTGNCVACHGATGNSVVPEWPNIAGQHESYIIEQMMAIRQGPTGPRNVPTMYPFVMHLSDQDIADMAAYYSQQTLAENTADPKLVKLGELIYRGGNAETGLPACIACHGATGDGNAAAKFPVVSGQHAAYSVLMLAHYANGTRATGPNHIMQDIAAMMSKQEMEAVASYMSGLRPRQ